jgi:hypothetical protein
MGTASVTYAAFPSVERRDEPFAGRGWTAYAAWAAFLTPFAIPGTVAQIAFVDFVNAVAFVVFFSVVLTRGMAVKLPFAVPLLLIGAGTLLSLTGAISLSASALAIAQDLYLYVWLVVLVTVLACRPEASEALARAWILSAVVVSGICFFEAIRARGLAGLVSLDEDLRTKAAFYNPNMCADYLVLSLFVLLALARSIRLRWVLAAAAVIGLALVSTKSNGGLISLTAGALAALGAWAWSGARAGARFGALAALAGVVLVTAWGLDEARMTDRWGRAVSEQSFVGRVEKSTWSRQTIWGELQARLAEHPLGIAPGNSSYQPVSIGNRVRKDSFQSKEAHSDYVAYLVERGPLALAGLLLATVQAILLVFWASRRSRRADTEGSRDARAIEFWTAACVGGLVATAVHSLVIEKLHFRHFWLFLAWVLASAVWVAAGRSARAARATAET